MNANQEDEVWAQALAAAIRAESAARGMRAKDVAVAAGLPPTNYHRIRWGTNIPDVVELRQIARALGLTLPHLLSLADARASELHVDESKAKTRAWIDRNRPPSDEAPPNSDNGDDAGVGS